jgi:hypothetical protein
MIFSTQWLNFGENPYQRSQLDGKVNLYLVSLLLETGKGKTATQRKQRKIT